MRKWLGIILFALIVIGAFIGYRLYGYIFTDNVKATEPIALFIPSDAKFESLLDSLEQKDLLINSKSFIWTSNRMKFRNIKSGKYIIQPDWNNRSLISHLRSGNQTPMNVTYNNVRTIHELSRELSNRLEPDSADFVNHFLDPDNLEKVQLDSQSILSLFIPNTYEFYWNSTPNSVFNKMIRENDNFWNEERSSLLDQSGFNKTEVYTLASIVQKETNLKSEKATVAGLYINRINKGILLQADPTVVFATGKFNIRRVLNKHLKIDSPYNTYLHKGLPPGPICMPDISTIDAVLRYEKHNYLYMCASADKPGAHAFASTLSQHNRNARIYRNWLNQNKIYK